MPIRRLGLVLVIALLSLPVMLSTAGAARQDESATEVGVHVNLCVAAGCTELPEASEPAGGVEVTLSSMDDASVLGSCVTGEAGTCVIPVEPVPGMV